VETGDREEPQRAGQPRHHDRGEQQRSGRRERPPREPPGVHEEHLGGEQLSATRSVSHRQAATAIETRSPEAVDNNSALIARHLEAAGDSADALSVVPAVGGVAHASRHQGSSRLLGAGQGGRRRNAGRRGRGHRKRIEPRARWALTEWLVGSSGGGERFVDELRLLTAATGDVLPLALAMSGRVTPNPMKILNSRLPRPPRSRHIETRRASGESPSSIYTTSRDATLRRERRTHRMASGDKATVGGRPSAPGR
jgi:hypothetical protein